MATGPTQASPTEDIVIRPSMKTVHAAYVLATIVAIAGMWAVFQYLTTAPRWTLALPWLFLLSPLRMHVARRLIVLRLQGDHLTVETGLLSRTRRTLDMAKIQDVTVSQTLGQRLLGTGDIMLETAGERGAIAIPNLDRPRIVADSILNTSRQGRHLL